MWLMSNLLGILLVAVLASSALAEPLTLVTEGRAACQIIAEEGDALAAQELQTYLHRMSGAMVRIARPWEEVEGPAIIVGQPDGWGLPKGELEALELGFDGVLLRRAGSRLILTGATPQGTLNAVYTFLDELGVRWYVPGEEGEVVPDRKTLQVDILDEVQRPAFRHRSIWYSLGSRGLTSEFREVWGEWLRRNRFGGVSVYVGHNFHNIVPASEWFEKDPELFALRDGKRDAEGQFCTTHPRAIEIAVQKVRDYFDAQPEATMYSLSPDDHNRWCQCDRCVALDPDEYKHKDTGKGRRLTIFANEVARQLRETHPDKNVAFYAYWGAVEAPPDVEAEPNVIVFFTPIGMAFNSALNDARSPLNQQHNEWYLKWRQIAHQMGIRHYYNFGSVLWIPYRQLAQELRYQHQNRALYVNAELWSHGEGSYLSWYLVGRLLWDLTVDEEGLFHRYMDEFYGPAAEPMRRYFTRLADAWSDCGEEIPWVHRVSGHQVFLAVLTPEVLAACGNDLAQAERRVDEDSVWAARLDLNRRFYTYMTAWRAFTEAHADSDAEKLSAATTAFRQAADALREPVPGFYPEAQRNFFRTED